MAITLVQSKTFADAYGAPDTTPDITLNSAPTAGNLLVTCIAIDKASGTITVPSGFTLVNKGQGGAASGAMAYKVAAGTEQTIQWSHVANEENSIWYGEYSGCTAAPLDQTTENETKLNSATNTISTGTTGTTSQKDEIAIALLAADSGNSVGSSRSWSNSFTSIAEVTTTSGSPFCAVAVKTLTAAGTVETTVSHNGSDECYAMIATFKASGPTKLKMLNGLEMAKIKTINGLAIAKVKTINGLV